MRIPVKILFLPHKNGWTPLAQAYYRIENGAQNHIRMVSSKQDGTYFGKVIRLW